jgi:hypothetical protein
MENMKPKKREDLLGELSSAEVFDLESPEGGHFVFCATGARLLGMFPSKNSWNVLWTHPQLSQTLQRGLWNLGGERLWISPERDFFYRNPGAFEGWYCPAEMDPGNYKLTEKDFQKGLTFQQKIELKNIYKNEVYPLTAARTYQAEPNPFPDRKNISYCGVKIRDQVETSFLNPLRIQPWTITQVFTGPACTGTVLIPVVRTCQPIHYFSPVPADRLTVLEKYAAYKIDGNAVYKIGITSADVDFSRGARILYLTPSVDGKNWFLIFKCSDDVPRSADKCYDVARSNPHAPAAAIQSYNSGYIPGEEQLFFGELELQLNPLLKRGKAGYCSEVTHQLFIFEGSKEDIVKLAEDILGLSQLVLFS